MIKSTKIIFFTVGIIILGLLFYSFGFEDTWHHLQQMGPKFLIIISIYFFNHLTLSWGWKILINIPIKLKDFPQLVLARIAGDSTSSVNALGAVAGEPLKAIYLKNLIPFKTGLASVILLRTIHTLANVLVILTGIIVSLFVLPIPRYIIFSTLILMLAALIFLLLLLKKQKEGFLNYVLAKIPNKIKSKILNPARQKKIDSLDQEIKHLFQNRKNLNDFYLSLFIHYFSILISGTLEIFFIIKFSGSINNITLTHALFIYIFGFLLTSATFFMPANLGTSEGSYILGLKLLGYQNFAGLGLYVGIVRRLRTFFWSLIGIIILFGAGLLNKSTKISAK